MTHFIKPDELIEPKTAEEQQAARARERHLIHVMTYIQELTPEDLKYVIEGLPLQLKRDIQWLCVTPDKA